jgi:hypothetical protein
MASKWRQYRAIEPDEFIVAFGDCSQGGEDSNFCQFMSATTLDFPLVYQARGVAVTMTQDIFPILEKIYDVTGIPPVVAFERNNGGQSEMQRLYDLNVKNKYRCFVMPQWGNVGIGAEETTLLGWNTDKATRPKMLGEWKSVFEKHLFRIFDEETIKQHKAFIIKNGKAQAAAHRHDDAVMSSAGAYQMFQICKPDKSGLHGSSGNTPKPSWVDNLPSWGTKWNKQ